MNFRAKLSTCLSLTAVLLFFISSCHRREADTVQVEGSFQQAGGTRLTFLEMGPQEIRAIDSTVPDAKGHFSFSAPATESGFWLLRTSSGKVLVMLMSPGDRIELGGTTACFPDHVTMQGPEEALLLDRFYQKTRLREHQVDSLETMLIDRQDSSDYAVLTQKIDTAFRRIWEEQRQEETDFIEVHPGSLASLVVLNYAFGIKPVLNPVDDMRYYIRSDSALYHNWPENQHVKKHHERVDILLKKQAVSH